MSLRGALCRDQVSGFRRAVFRGILLFLYMLTSPAQAQDVLRVAGWDVYADPDNPAKTIGYQQFEAATGVVIEFTPLENLDQIVDLAESNGNYDVFIVSNEGIDLLHDMRLVRSLDLAKLPNYQNLHPSLRHSEWAHHEGHVHAVPWAWGPTGLLYDTTVLKNPDSWNVLWSEKYRGRVALWDDFSMIWTAALALGYENVYSLTRQQLAEVKEKLLALNENIHSYYAGGDDVIKLIKSGEVVALNSWYDPSSRLREAGHEFKMLIPKEGAVGMFDSYMISSGSGMSDIAHDYINHQISPPIQRDMVEITGLAPANIETLVLLDAAEIMSLHLNEADYFDRMLLWDHMPRKHLYEEVLDAVKLDLAARRR